jgi:hypothetical protein
MRISTYILILFVLFGMYYMYGSVKKDDPPPSNGNVESKKPSPPKDINIYLVSLDNASMYDWYDNLQKS